jgi:carboxyl-terminal processing protease
VLAGFGVGYLVFSPHSTISVMAQESRANLDEYWEAWDILRQNHIADGSTAPSDLKKVQYSIRGLVASYDDPHMDYFTPEYNKQFKQDVRGSFGGIGAEVGLKDSSVTVIAPLKGSPAEKAGIQSGDIIIRIDGKPTFEMEGIDEAISYIRGPKNSTVTLDIVRIDSNKPTEITFDVVRDTIQIPSHEALWRGDTLVLSVFTFDQDLIKKITPELKKLATRKHPRLIIDLRDNPGGFLEVAVDFTSLILPAGDVIVSEKPGIDKVSKETLHRSKGLNLVNRKTPIVVIINEGSASASEIVAGALLDHKRATIIGSQSFGKGSVQELVDLSTGAGLKITVAKWYTPKGTSLSKSGITPQVAITDTTPNNDIDDVLQKAFSLVQS